MVRSNQNWFALGSAVLYLICFLFLPFYHVIVIGMSGMVLMQYGYAIMYLPLALALLMAVSALIFDPRVSIGVGILSALATSLLMIMGRSVLLTGNALTALASNTITQSAGVNLTALLPVAPGVGGIVCIVLCAAFIVLEVLLNSQRRKAPRVASNPIDEDYF